jgi:regulator of RNase E activity RraA
MEREPDQFTTADLCDEFGSLVRVAEPLFKDYGAIGSFSGQITAVRVFEDNVLVREALHAVPRRSGKEGVGIRDVPVRFAGISLDPGEYLYADADGIIVAERELL